MVIEDNHEPDSPDEISKNNNYNDGDKKSKHKYVKVLPRPRASALRVGSAFVKDNNT